MIFQLFILISPNQYEYDADYEFNINTVDDIEDKFIREDILLLLRINR